jgi:hypothetical protein
MSRRGSRVVLGPPRPRLPHRRAAILILSSLAESAACAARATPVPAWGAEERAVMAPIQKMLDAAARHDKAAIQSVLMPEGIATLVRHGNPIQVRLAVFTDRMPPATTKIEERLHDPLIRIDHDIAMVWAYYEYWRNGTFEHCGTDVYNLVRQSDGTWLISGISDTARRDCSGT